MIHDKKVIVVMPAYNAEKTLEKTYSEIPQEYVDEIILVDDASQDRTADVSKKLNIRTVTHARNRGYGGNQKTCYKEALKRRADVVVMIHPDYQYTPKLLVAMASLIAIGQYDIVLGSRILRNGALRGGCPYTSTSPSNLNSYTEYSAENEAFRIPYRLSGVITRGPVESAVRGKFG